MDWATQCLWLQGENPLRTEAQILVRLGSGIEILGPMEFEAAKSIFRDPRDITKLLGGVPLLREAIVVLPVATIQAINYPHMARPDA